MIEQQTSSDLYEQVTKVLDLIRPAIQSDGGDVELVTITDQGVVQIRFRGACVGCPSCAMTLKMGVERTLRQKFPQVSSVVAIN